MNFYDKLKGVFSKDNKTAKLDVTEYQHTFLKRVLAKAIENTYEKLEDKANHGQLTDFDRKIVTPDQLKLKLENTKQAILKHSNLLREMRSAPKSTMDEITGGSKFLSFLAKTNLTACVIASAGLMATQDTSYVSIIAFNLAMYMPTVEFPQRYKKIRYYGVSA